MLVDAPTNSASSNGQLHAVGRSQASHRDPRVLRIHQGLRDFLALRSHPPSETAAVYKGKLRRGAFIF